VPAQAVADPATSAAVFAQKVLKQPLWPHQVQAAESDAFITAIAAARRTGKSTLAEVLAIWTAFRERNVKVLVLSATQEASRRVTEGIAATLNARQVTRGAVVDDFATRIKLTNGSEIISLPASQRQIRGYGKRVRLVILDEAGFMPQELWAAAHYTALDERPKSRLLLLGTPWAGTDHFFRREFMAGTAGEEDHAAFQWTYKANPNLDHRYLERQRDRVSPQEYAAEVLGEWGSATGALFSHDLLHRATADIEVPALAELTGPARGIVGCDWGLSYDVSAACGVFRLPVAGLNADREPLPTFVLLPWTWPQGEPLHRVVADVVQASPSFVALCSETNGIGAMPSQELGRRCRAAHPAARFVWNWVSTTAASKTAGYSCLLGLMQRGQIVLPRHPLLLRQLAGVRFEVRARGLMGVNTDDVPHDDVADSAYLATLPFRSPTGHRVICRLATLAGDRAAPDERVPELDCEVVRTGDGLRVYQRPALQGVSTREPGLSLYAPVAPPEPEGVRAGRFFLTGAKSQ
jgi:hypothetical protein